MKQVFNQRAIMGLLLLCGGVQLSAVALADNVSGTISKSNLSNIPAAQLQQSYTWYDGDIKREVWLNPQLMAEFNPTLAQKNQISATTLGIRVAIENENAESVRFWRVDPQTTANAAIQSFSVGIESNPVSAVLHDGASTGSGMRALPGNIILYLNPDWDQATAERWIKQNKLQVVSQRKLISNVYIIKSKPGLESLLKANALYESGDVVAAFPNWWRELVSK